MNVHGRVGDSDSEHSWQGGDSDSESSWQGEDSDSESSWQGEDSDRGTIAWVIFGVLPEYSH